MPGRALIWNNKSYSILYQWVINLSPAFMKNMIGSGFSTEMYEWVWFSKILNIGIEGVLKISAVRLYPKV